MPIVYYDQESGLLDLYVQFDNANDDILTLPEGLGDKLRRYAVEDPEIVTLLALPAGVYNVTVRRGDYQNPTVTDEIKGGQEFVWNGTNEINIVNPEVTVQLDSGGGVLAARIGVAQLTPEGYLEIVQGEDKRITFIVEAKGRFVTPSADEITVKFQDTKKVSQTVENADIDRVTEEMDIQVFRANLTAVQTAAMAPGLAIVEIAFDTQKTVLPYAVNIIKRIPGT